MLDRMFRSIDELEMGKYAIGLTALVDDRLNCPIDDLGGGGGKL